jgi:hypothetical protein
MRIEGEPSVFRRNVAGRKAETVNIGNPAGTIDDAIGLDRPLRPTFIKDDAKPVSATVDPLDIDPSVHGDPDSFSLSTQLSYGIAIHIGEQPR